MRFAWMAALCLVAPATLAARSYTVEDMLAAEDYGRALFSPGGDRVVIERLGGHRTAARFTYDYFVRRARSRVMTAAVAGSGGLVPLFPQEAGSGYWIGSFAPSGKRLTVYRLKRDRLSLGVVDMATRRVAWLAMTPDQPAGQANPVWLDDDRLVAVALRPGDLPLPLDFGGRAQKQLPRYWERTARGRTAAMSVVGSGADLQAGVTHRPRRLVLADVSAGTVRTLATGDYVDMAVSPYRRHVALVERGEAVPAPSAAEPLSLDFQSRRLRLSVVGLDGHSVSPCIGCDLAPDLLAWSGDGARLLFFSRPDGVPWERGSVTVYDARSGRTAPLDTQGITSALVRTIPGRSTIRAGWFGTSPVLFGTQGGGRADWFLLGNRGAIGLAGGNAVDGITPMRAGEHGMCLLTGDGLWSVGSDGAGRLTVPGKGIRIVSDPLGGYDVGTRILLEAVRATPTVSLGIPDGDAMRLVSAGCGDGASQPVARIDRGGTILGVSPIASVGIAVSVSPHGIGTLSFVGRGARMLDRINRHLAAVDRPRSVALHRPGHEGSLTDWLLLPPGQGPQSRRLPLVVMPYPGAVNDDAPPRDFGLADFEPMLSPPLLAAHGYAVLEPSLPIGSKEPVEDIITALRPAIAAAIATGQVDPTRIGVLGHSYGGYTALMMATEMPCLRSVVASAAVSDLLLAYGSLDARLKLDFAEGLSTTYPFAWAEDGQGRMGVPPWRDPALYLRNSPFYRLDRVTAPILLLHGDLDPLPVSDVERAYAALYRLGKEARLVRFYGEGHVPQSPATIRARWRETFAWLDRTMGERAARAGSTEGLVFEPDGTCRPPSRP